MKHITRATEFDALLLKAEQKLVVVDVYADWCGPCKMIAPVFASLAHTYASEAVFVKLDGDQPGNKELTQRYGVRGYPSFLFFRGGKLLDTLVGADSGRLERLVKQYVVPPAPPEPRSPFRLIPETRFQLNGAVGKLGRAAERIRKVNAERLTEEQLGHIDRISGALDSKSTRIEKVASSLGPFREILTGWPLAEVFPCCDILRCLVATVDGAEAMSLMRGTALDVVEPLMATIAKTPSTKMEAAGISMALDVFVNGFYQEKSLPFAVLGSLSDSVLISCLPLFPKSSISYSKLLLNRAVLATAKSIEALLVQCCKEVAHALQLEQMSANAELLVAAGTLYWRYHLLITHHKVGYDATAPAILASVALPAAEGKLEKLISEVQQVFELGM